MWRILNNTYIIFKMGGLWVKFVIQGLSWCLMCMCALSLAHLQGDGQVDSGAKCGADCAWWKAQVFEQLGEGLWECQPRPFLCHHNTAPHTWQIHTPRLQPNTTIRLTHTGMVHSKAQRDKIMLLNKGDRECDNVCARVCSPSEARSACPGSWCRAPWQSRSRRCLWSYTDWVCSATEGESPPAPLGEWGWTDDLNTHCSHAHRVSEEGHDGKGQNVKSQWGQGLGSV